MKLTVIGLGYIGLPTALLFASKGIKTTGVDINKEIISSLKKGVLPIEEPGLQDLLNEVIQNEVFTPSTEIEKGDYYIIAVPTPSKPDNSCDFQYLISAIEGLNRHIKKGDTIIVESTISPRTTIDIVKPLIEKQGYEIGKDVYLAHCPERVLPGQILYEMVNNNRIIGGVTEECIKKTKELYKIVVKGKLYETDASTAEMAKLMENTYRDVNIGLANELVRVCSELNINALDVISLANEHPRVALHQPGPGVGGHCLAIDPYFIISSSPDEAKIINKAREVNKNMPEFVIDKTHRIMEKLKGNNIGVLGLAYKGNIDDIRESPALEIYTKLKNDGRYNVIVHDPYVKIDWVEKNLFKAIESSDLLLILTDHDEYQNLDKMFTEGNKPIIFDTKNIMIVKEGDYFNFNNIFEV